MTRILALFERFTGRIDVFLQKILYGEGEKREREKGDRGVEARQCGLKGAKPKRCYCS